MNATILPALLGLLLPVLGAAAQPAATSLPATPATRALQQQALALAPRPDAATRADLERGLVAPLDLSGFPPGSRPGWSAADSALLDDPVAPDTVHPVLWQHARDNRVGGLFKVTEGLYQVRGLDISNLTVIEGDSGLLVVDTLLTAEAAQVAMQLYFRHRPVRPVRAVIYTHSHADHFGGVRGVVDEADVRSGKVRIYAPEGFEVEAAAENVTAGGAMLRRTHYQFGPLLPRGPQGLVDVGLGKSSSAGATTLIMPTDIITAANSMQVIDGVPIEFMLTPGTEAPSGLVLYLPRHRVLDMGEIATQNQHNLLPLRGAQVRDALAWSRQIDTALQRFGPRSDVMIAQHHWPVFGRERLQGFLERQRDTYRFVHDQAVRWMNHGYTPAEIAERVQLPASLLADRASHPLYGSLKHNVKAVYQRYLGWYDAHPANLDPLPPVEEARRMIDYMGGSAAALERARADFKRGDYRWVARVASMAVMADPTNESARALAAAAFEQLGYQAESATVRNAYLQGARELRTGVPAVTQNALYRPDLIRAMSLPQYFDFLAVRLDAAKVAGRRLRLLWSFTDSKEHYLVEVGNSVMHARRVEDRDVKADATLALDRATLDAISQGQTDFLRASSEGRLVLGGNADAFREWLSWLDRFPAQFPIVTPRPE
jgi:alkyl sulfatase BDS1-like metallo-beta-lactamase superfamily hydrolase